MIFKFGDNIDTDVIIPARYLTSSDTLHLAAHCMHDIDINFAKVVKDGDIIIAGSNFGCGSSREHAPLALKACGIKYIIASSFARIFYRNAINIGLVILECKDASLDIDVNDSIYIDVEKGLINNITKNKIYTITPLPPFILEIVKSGGLMQWIKK